MNNLSNIINNSNFNLINWNQEVMLMDEEFVVETSYDALNRPVTITQPDNTVIMHQYDKG